MTHRESVEALKLARELRQFGWIVECEWKPELITFALKTTAYDVILIDWQGNTSKQLLQTIRTIRPSLPVLISESSPLDRCDATRTTWCDVIRKPFKTRELIMQAMLLVHEREQVCSVLRCNDVVLDQSAHLVSKQGEPVALARKELQLLELLLRHKNKLVTHSEINDHIWERDEDPITNSVEVHISRLRKKLQDDDKRLIRTVHGMGYMMKD